MVMFSMVGLFTSSVEPRLELEQGLLDNDDDIDFDEIDDYLSTFLCCFGPVGFYRNSVLTILNTT